MWKTKPLPRNSQAPPDRHRADAPRFFATERKKSAFSSTGKSEGGTWRMYSSERVTA